MSAGPVQAASAQSAPHQLSQRVSHHCIIIKWWESQTDGGRRVRGIRTVVFSRQLSRWWCCSSNRSSMRRSMSDSIPLSCASSRCSARFLLLRNALPLAFLAIRMRAARAFCNTQKHVTGSVIVDYGNECNLLFWRQCIVFWTPNIIIKALNMWCSLGLYAVQRQKAVSAYFTRKQILSFGCAEQYNNADLRIHRNFYCT